MEAVCSPEMSEASTMLHGITFEKTAIFITARTISDPKSMSNSQITILIIHGNLWPMWQRVKLRSGGKEDYDHR
jgi:hypothetical protein